MVGTGSVRASHSPKALRAFGGAGAPEAVEAAGADEAASLWASAPTNGHP